MVELINMNKKISTPIAIGIILILSILVGGFFFFESQKGIIQIPGIEISGKECSDKNPNLCNKNCDSDTDCQFTCGCNCVSKDENCLTDIKCKTLPSSACKCNNNKCEFVGFQDETADWNTYRNEEYGFSINYFKNLEISQPEDTIICDMSGEVPTPIGCAVYNPNQLEYLSVHKERFIAKDKSEYTLMGIRVLDNKKLLSLSDWYDNYSKAMFVTMDPIPLDKRISINVAGASSYIMEEGCCESFDYNAYIPKGDKIFIISLGGYRTNPEKIKEYLIQMLSTFKFID